MKEETKEKLAKSIETLLYFGGIAFGFSILVGGLYALYTVVKALIG